MDFLYPSIILPLIIFVARIIDVSLGTIRIIFVSKGFKFFAFVIGFFEVLIWLIIINQVWSNLSNPWLYFAYAAGFATGTYTGMCIDERIRIGNVLIRIIIRKNSKKLISELKKEGCVLTTVDAISGSGEKSVKMIFLVVKRKEIKKIFKIIKRVNPKAFFTLEDIRSLRNSGYQSIAHKEAFGKNKHL